MRERNEIAAAAVAAGARIPPREKERARGFHKERTCAAWARARVCVCVQRRWEMKFSAFVGCAAAQRCIRVLLREREAVCFSSNAHLPRGADSAC